MRCTAELMLLKKTTPKKRVYLHSPCQKYWPQICRGYDCTRGKGGLVARTHPNREELACRAWRERRDTKIEGDPKIRN